MKWGEWNYWICEIMKLQNLNEWSWRERASQWERAADQSWIIKHVALGLTVGRGASASSQIIGNNPLAMVSIFYVHFISFVNSLAYYFFFFFKFLCVVILGPLFLFLLNILGPLWESESRVLMELVNITINMDSTFTRVSFSAINLGAL